MPLDAVQVHSGQLSLVVTVASSLTTLVITTMVIVQLEGKEITPVDISVLEPLEHARADQSTNKCCIIHGAGPCVNNQTLRYG